MIKVHTNKNFPKTEKFLEKAKKIDAEKILNKYGQMGVEALAMATPKDTGLTSESWDYKIEKNNSGYSINWFNTNTSKGVPIALLLQFGHAARDGSFVVGIDYINPALAPIFKEIANELWREVTNK